MLKFAVSIFISILSLVVSAETIELKVKPDVIKQEIKDSGNMSLSLPEFEVFNASGAGVYHEQSLSKDFKVKLNDALYSKVENGKRLEKTLSRFSTYEGSDFKLENRDYEFVFIEYWADWCDICKQQMKQVKEFISSHPKSKILWLKVEKDPTKIEGFDPTK